YEAETLVADYRTKYNYSTVTKISRIKHVTICDIGENCLVPITIDYQTEISPEYSPSVSAILDSGAGWAPYQPHFQDLNGDGLADLIMLYSDSNVNYGAFLSKGDGTFEKIAGAILDPGTGWASYQPHFQDLNGDGLADLAMVHSGSNVNYEPFLLKLTKSPYHLDVITTSRGHETSISYTPLTDKLVYSKG
ncbi:hypothetical protein WH96_20885, partial [Kiloniella spongiae]